jgi:hypothetical protein
MREEEEEEEEEEVACGVWRKMQRVRRNMMHATSCSNLAPQMSVRGGGLKGR